MFVLWARIDVKVFENGAAEAGLGKHSLDRVFENGDGLLVQLLAYGSEALSTRITCVVNINFLFHLSAGEDDFFGIDNDDIIATITVGSIACLPLASQDLGHFLCETA